MKKMKILMMFLCVLTIFMSAGCGDKELPSAKIVRDDQRTGGSLSFVYDSRDRVIYIGGEDEVVQFSSANEEKGYGEGCRIGLKVTAPDEELDIENATLEMHGVNYSSGDFLEVINGQKQRFFNIYPLVSKEDKEIYFTVKWQDGTKAQEYKIVVVEGTKFMQSDGSVQ
ncbi:MAG: hypothetical protein ACI4R8_02780 [Candidatus Caccovivens sp.]